jgi:hypothetical protein
VPRGPDRPILEDRAKPGNGGTGYIKPDNAYIEAFNARLRAECLNASWFLTMADARDRIEQWRKEYNPASQHPSAYEIEVKRFC